MDNPTLYVILKPLEEHKLFHISGTKEEPVTELVSFSVQEDHIEMISHNRSEVDYFTLSDFIKQVENMTLLFAKPVNAQVLENYEKNLKKEYDKERYEEELHTQNKVT